MKITAVSYLNTLPFIYGIEQRVAAMASSFSHATCTNVAQADQGLLHGDVLLSLAVPSDGVKAVFNEQTDIALIPVGAIPLIQEKIPTAKIITDYCIGAEGPVETVALFSDTPLKDIHTVYLDGHSRTSVLLVRVLARDWWGITPDWAEDVDVDKILLKKGEGLVAIGDKTFDIGDKKYGYKYDLAEEWGKLTEGMPFVFAAWVGVTSRGVEYADTLNEALRYGVEHIAESITDTVRRSRNFDFGTAHRYLTENIKFNFDGPKRKALQLFWEKIITPG